MLNISQLPALGCQRSVNVPYIFVPSWVDCHKLQLSGVYLLTLLSVWQYGRIYCAYVVSCCTLLKHKWLFALLQQRLRGLFRSREWSCEIMRLMRAISQQEMKTWQVQDKLAQKHAHWLLSVETVPNILNATYRPRRRLSHGYRGWLTLPWRRWRHGATLLDGERGLGRYVMTTEYQPRAISRGHLHTWMNMTWGISAPNIDDIVNAAYVMHDRNRHRRKFSMESAKS